VLKSGHFFCSRELPRNIDAYVLRDSSAPLRVLLWKAGGFGFPFGLLLVFGVAGLVLCYERLPAPLRWFLLLYPLSVVLVFVSARYRTPVVPALAVVAAGGCFALPRAIAAGRWRRVVVAAAAALLALVLGTLPGPYPQERANYRAELEYFLGTRALNADDLDSAEARLRRAVELQKDHGDAHNHLGIVYSRMRKLALAIEQFELAVESNGRSVTARTNLARLYAARGRFDEALEQFRVAVEQDPFDIDLHRHFGLTLLELRRLDEATEHLRLVVRARPDDAATRTALDRALREIRGQLP
jgi:tetratricopeptide (TPR) repeat protein